MGISERWYATKDRDRRRVRLSGVTVEASTLTWLRGQAGALGLSLGRTLEKLLKVPAVATARPRKATSSKKPSKEPPAKPKGKGPKLSRQ